MTIKLRVTAQKVQTRLPTLQATLKFYRVPAF